MVPVCCLSLLLVGVPITSVQQVAGGLVGELDQGVGRVLPLDFAV